MTDKLIIKIIHPYKERIDTSSDLIDIEVGYKGKMYRGCVSTPKFVSDRMEDYHRTGENAKGAYFCAKGLVILKDLEKTTISSAVRDLANRGDLETFFS